MDKTLRLVRIFLLISAIQRVLHLFSGKLFYKSNRKLFPCVCIAWYKHSSCWENSRQLCKPSTSSLVSITVSNSPNPSRVYIRLCKHGKRFLLLKHMLSYITCVMLCYTTWVMFCYTTWVMLCYITCVMLCYITWVMLCNITCPMLCYITCVMLCYITCVMLCYIRFVVLCYVI